MMIVGWLVYEPARSTALGLSEGAWMSLFVGGFIVAMIGGIAKAGCDFQGG